MISTDQKWFLSLLGYLFQVGHSSQYTELGNGRYIGHMYGSGWAGVHFPIAVLTVLCFALLARKVLIKKICKNNFHTRCKCQDAGNKDERWMGGKWGCSCDRAQYDTSAALFISRYQNLCNLELGKVSYYVHPTCSLMPLYAQFVRDVPRQMCMTTAWSTLINPIWTVIFIKLNAKAAELIQCWILKFLVGTCL